MQEVEIKHSITEMICGAVFTTTQSISLNIIKYALHDSAAKTLTLTVNY